MKEPKEGQEFIDILQKEDYGHMVLFSSAEKQQALNFFKYTNYYRFSVFPRLVVEDNKRTFSNVLYLYNVDKYIRKQLSHFSGILEEWIKTSLANVISNNYNSDEYQQAEFYLDLNIYGKEEQGKEILASFAETVTRSKEVYIKYHHREKNGCIPVWVLIEELTFGQIDTFISQLKPEYKNMWIDKVFGKQYRKFVVSWVGAARYIRNMTAHHARFYSKRFVVFPSLLPKEDLKKYSIKNSQKDNLFVMLFTEKKLFSFLPDRAIQDEWNLFIDDLSELVDHSDDLFNCEENGFKEDWRTALKIF
ncbi:Abi family protein [Enterococcus durans]